MNEVLPNEVHLKNDEVTVYDEGQQFPCEVILRTEPTPRVLFKIKGINPWICLQHRMWSIQLVQAKVTCDAFINQVSSDPEVIVTLTPSQEPITVGNSDSLSYVEFDILNFPSFLTIEAGKVRGPENQLDISVDPWLVSMRPQRQSPETEAFRSPLYSVTHSCVVRRHDGAAFSSTAVTGFVVLVHEALSFAAGRWVAPVLVRGFNPENQLAWEEWGTRLIQPSFGHVETWFDTHHGQTIADVLRGMQKLRSNPDWARTLHSALYWYLRSTLTAAGVDGGTILLQAALELLSWQVFVSERKALSADGFSRLPADDQIRLLLETCGVPTTIPAGLDDLLAEAKGRNWHDGPKALAGIRNLLVHPRGLKDLPYYDTWRLGEWYVELIILNKLNFAGVYSNRTKAQRWVGDVEYVPWASPPT